MIDCGIEQEEQNMGKMLSINSDGTYVDEHEERKRMKCFIDNQVYISGPMTGIKNNNREKFDEAEHFLKEIYRFVYNPASLPDNLEPQDYEMIEPIILKHCNVIYLLKGWNKSVGARRELEKFLEYHKDGEIVLEGE